MRQNRSKGLISARASEKKIKKSQESDISPNCPEVPREGIFTKLGINIPLVDIIKCDKFCDNLFKVLNFTGGQISNFPIGIDVAVITLLRYRAACSDSNFFLHKQCIDIRCLFRLFRCLLYSACLSLYMMRSVIVIINKRI